MATKGIVKDSVSAESDAFSDIDLLRAEKAELERRIEELVVSKRQKALEDVRRLISTFELTAGELGLSGGRGRPAKKARASVAPKYRDPSTGSTWSGRGKPPKWIAGVAKDERDSFAV